MNPARLLVNMLLPPRCAGCKAVAHRDGVLCATCWTGLDRLGDHLCAQCGVPFPVAIPENTLCGRCLAEPPAFDQARAVFAYAGTGRDLILGLKHTDRVHLARMIGGWMAPIVRHMAPQDHPPILIPVPLHWSRLWHRQYNQSHALAASIAQHLGTGIIMDNLVIRHRATRPQGSPGTPKRADNVRQAFRVHHPERIAGQSVVLVDDVMTSGSTAHEIAKLLKKHRAARISVVTAARAGQE